MIVEKKNSVLIGLLLASGLVSSACGGMGANDSQASAQSYAGDSGWGVSPATVAWCRSDQWRCFIWTFGHSRDAHGECTMAHDRCRAAGRPTDECSAREKACRQPLQCESEWSDAGCEVGFYLCALPDENPPTVAELISEECRRE